MAQSLDTLELVVTTARVRVNDAIQSIGGNTLTDNAPFTIYYINPAWRRLQERLVDYGSSELKSEITLLTVPGASTADPTVRTVINWTSVPALPADMISPLRLWERPRGSGSMTEMKQCFNGMPLVTPGTRNRIWEWRKESIVLPGATVNTDIQLRYACYLPDFVQASTTPFSSQAVPITRSLNAFAWLICSEFSHVREDLDAGYFDSKAEEAIQQIWGRDPAQYRAISKGGEYQKLRTPTTPLDGSGAPTGGQ